MPTVIPTILLILFAQVVTAQTCLSLQGSTVCGPFEDYEIEIPAANPFTNVSGFDNFLRNRYDNVPAYIDDFKTRYDCPNYVGAGQRFHIGYLCALFVDTATTRGCNAAGTTFYLCKNSAEASMRALEAMFASSKFCTQIETPARATLLKTYQQYISRIPSNATQCIAGLAHEVGTCGHLTNAEANVYCESVPNDTCCSQRGQTSPLVIDTTSQSNNSNGKSSGLSTGVIIGAGVGGFVLLLIIIFLIVLCARKKTKNTVGGIPQTRSDPDDLGVSETYQVIYNYVPNLSDEVQLYVGDPVIVKVKFDDGWALGYNLSTKQEGSFPLACVAPYDGNDEYVKKSGNAKFGQRASSLYIK